MSISAAWGKKQKASAQRHLYVVRWTSELDRVLAIPKRELALDGDLTSEFLRPGSSAKLLPIQSAALSELRRVGGLFGAIRAGAGKTLIGLLAARVAGARQAVYLCPAQAKLQLLADHKKWSKEFFLPVLDEELFVLSHEELSSKKKATYLRDLRPDLIICDEAHKFKHSTAARTKRLIRYLRQENPGCSLVVLTGTVSDKSLLEYAHLSELALRKWSPLPDRWDSWPSLAEWAEAIDVPAKKEEPRNPGALGALMTNEEALKDNLHEALRGAYRRRLTATPGVVATAEGEVGSTLYIVGRRPEVPAEITRVLQHLRRTWEIGGEEIYEATRLWDVARQVALGFYYVWDWPDGVPDLEWLQLRAVWHKALRSFLAHQARVGLDSALLVSNAADAGKLGVEITEAWRGWKSVKERPEPKTRAVWIDEFAARDAAAFLDEDDGIVWYDRKAFGQKVAELSGAALCGGGDNAKIIALDGAPCVASIRAHGTAKNLQAWWRQLVAGVSPSGQTVEQLLARTHRPGQKHDEVYAEIYLHSAEFREAVKSAITRAQYQQQTLGQEQRLLYSAKVNFNLDA